MNNFSSEHQYPSVFFDECQNGKYIARALQTDTDCSAVESVFAGPASGIYSIDSLCCGTASAGGNWAKGYYKNELSDCILMEKVRKILETCERP